MCLLQLFYYKRYRHVVNDCKYLTDIAVLVKSNVGILEEHRKAIKPTRKTDS